MRRTTVPYYLCAPSGRRTHGAVQQPPWDEGADTGLVRGSVSPNAIVVTYEGQVRVRGLGIGRSVLLLPPSHTRLAYRAPELIEGRGWDRRADIYSLGVVLYDV